MSEDTKPPRDVGSSPGDVSSPGNKPPRDAGLTELTRLTEEAGGYAKELDSIPESLPPEIKPPEAEPSLFDLLPPGWLGRWNRSSLTKLVRLYLGPQGRVWKRADTVEIGFEQGERKLVLAIGGDWESAWRALCLAVLREQARLEQEGASGTPNPIEAIAP